MAGPIRVLYVHGDIMLRGGTEAYMMNYYRNMDRKLVQVDFVVHGFGEGVYDDEIRSLGGKIYHVPVKSKDPFGNIRALKEIFTSGDYKIVHAHANTSNAWILNIARQCGVPVRISHSHSTAVQSSNRLKIFLNNILKKKIAGCATHLFACSDLPGRWLYGDKDFRVIANAIDLERFSFDKISREKIRAELGIKESDIVLGHVGRFSEEKNQAFLINLIKKLSSIDRRYKLILIGDGPLKNEVIEQGSAYQLEDQVWFIPACGNVNAYYNAFDYFCLPSLFEGIPVVGIEAQANGLCCLISDTVPRELDITHNLTYLPIDSTGVNAWADHILQHFPSRDDKAVAKVQGAGYDIHSAAQELCKFYLACF